MAKKGDTSETTFFHEICTGIYMKEPNANIKNGLDVQRYIVNKTIVPAITTNNKDVKPTSMDKLPQRRFLSAEYEPNIELLNDAQKLAKELVKIIGKPSGSVYWTGPTNDTSKYGAADITCKINNKIEPISLKYGPGQLKNKTINTFGEIAFEGIIEEGKDFSEVILEKDIKLLDEMTSKWLDLCEKYTPKEIQSIISSYKKSIKGSWKKYQSQKLTKSEEELILSFFKSKGKKITNTNSKSLNLFCKKLYSTDFGNKNSFEKDWRTFTKEHFPKIFKKYFEKDTDLLKDNLIKIFKSQMSIGGSDMWYGASGGKKILFIPNMDSFKERKKDFSFKYSFKEIAGSFILSLTVLFDKKKFTTIDMNIRWAQGQMVRLPDVKSVFAGKVDTKLWNDIWLS